MAFLGAWQEDLDDWEIACRVTDNVGSTWEAMTSWGSKWRLAESGDTQVAKPQRGAARRIYDAAERRAQALNCAS